MNEPQFPRTVPQVNNNGTSRDELIEQRRLTRAAVNKAIKLLREQCPHGRDYQTMMDSGRYEEARALYNSRLSALQELADDLQAEALAILHQGKESAGWVSGSVAALDVEIGRSGSTKEQGK